MATSSSTTLTTVPEIVCPAWCTDHDGFDDGSDDWHESRTIAIHDFEFYISTGTISGQPELFMSKAGLGAGLGVTEAAEVAQAILGLVNEVRS